MLSKLKAAVFSAFQRFAKLLWGTGIGRIPGAYWVHGLLFQLLWPSKSIIEIQGSKMHVDPKGLPKSYIKTFQAYILSSSWEELTTEMFKKVVKEGDTVLDLGANLGYFTLLAARLVGEKGRVYAFEPEPTNYSLLLKNIELNGYSNVVAVQKAVSDVKGKVKFFLDSRDTGAHTIYQSGDRKKYIEIEAVTLDDFLKDENHRVNVIKMDIEGAELAALSGMQQIIRESDNLKIFAEFHLPAIASSGISPQEFISRLMEDYHFSILAIGDYARDKKYSEINDADELMNLCQGSKTANLFLEKR